MDDVHKYEKSADDLRQTYQLHISMHETIAKGTHKLENGHLCPLSPIEKQDVDELVSMYSM